MSKPFSNSQIAKLGDRLRDGAYTAADLMLLSEYRASFAPALAEVVAGIRSIGGVELTERAEKSTQSIAYKLQRMRTTQLGQLQDIAGCRIVVDGIQSQDHYAELLKRQFPDSRLHDLRDKPHSGYRAVHIVARSRSRRVEVQIRTRLQDLWAQCSEHWAFSIDPAIKYGCGDSRIINVLLVLSGLIAEYETNWRARLEEALEEFEIDDNGLDRMAAVLGRALNDSLLELKGSAALFSSRRED